MGKKAPSAPAAPDPAATTAAAAKTNRETAITQFGLNAINQRDPYGSLQFNQIGTWADGTPRFEAVQSLAPEEQRALDLSRQAQDIYGQAGVQQLQSVRERLATPLSLNNEAVESRLMELGSRRLNPVLAERRNAMDTRLRQQGLMPGTQAYDVAMRSIGEAENDAYNQLLLTGRGQAINEILTERASPLNEAAALLTGQQVQAPSFVNTPQTSVAPTDYMQAEAMRQASLNNAFNARNQSYNTQLSGMYGLGSAAIGAGGRYATYGGMGRQPAPGQPAAPSDRRLKREIRRVGTWVNGLPIYVWRYIWGGPLQMGFMADEVAQVHPEAVLTGPGGFFMVRYDLAVR
jgi:hypothetical protein